MMMISRVTSVENWDIIEPHVQVSPNIIKINTRISARRKGKNAKSVRSYIAWEEEDESSSSSSCLSPDDECANFCLMARKKGETSKVYNSDSDNDYS